MINIDFMRGPDMPNEVKKSPPVLYRSLSQIARRFPPNKGDKPVHPATLTRWILEGSALSDGSRVKLRAVRFPAGWRTTDDWVNEFLEAITTNRFEGKLVTSQSSIRKPVERRRSHAKAKKELKASGF
jgi:hypothetical protein